MKFLKFILLIFIITAGIHIQAAEPKVFMIIPQLKLENKSITETLQEIKLLSKDTDPSGIGVNIVIDDLEKKLMNRKVTLNLNNIPVKDAIKYVLIGTKFRITYKDNANTVFITSTVSKQLIVRFYSVSSSFPSFVSPQNIKDASNRDKLKSFITGVGVNFPEGSNVTYMPGKSKISMNNTTDNHEKLIKALLFLGCLRIPK